MAEHLITLSDEAETGLAYHVAKGGMELEQWAEHLFAELAPLAKAEESQEKIRVYLAVQDDTKVMEAISVASEAKALKSPDALAGIAVVK